MKKLFCFLFIYIIANLAATAQSDPQFSFNKLTHLTVNPGFAGSSYGINGLILNRYQWSGFGNSPKTLVFSVSNQTQLFGSESGVGLNIISDEQGFEQSVRFNFNYAYRVKTGLGDLGIGVSAGFLNKTYSGEWTTPDSEGDYDYWDADDPLAPTGDESNVGLDFGFGLFLKSKDYIAGVSVAHINQASIMYNEEEVDYFARHYYLLGAYNISLSDPLFVLQPTVFVKTDLASLQADISIDVSYDNRISGGLGYRLNDAIFVLLGYELPNGLRAGYAFDLVTSAIGRYGYGSHEFFISYTVDLGKGRLKRYKSVRFL